MALNERDTASPCTIIAGLDRDRSAQAAAAGGSTLPLLTSGLSNGLMSTAPSGRPAVCLAGNTSAFNCRIVPGTAVWSQHAYGLLWLIALVTLIVAYAVGTSVLQHVPARRPAARWRPARRPAPETLAARPAAPLRARPAPSCPARRNSLRSSCATTRTALRPGAPSRLAARKPARSPPVSRCGSRRRRARRAPLQPVPDRRAGSACRRRWSRR